MLKSTGISLPYTLIETAGKNLDFFKDVKNVLNQPSGNFFYDSWEVKDTFKGTIWDEILSFFPSDIGEARIIRLGSGKCYLQHADIDDRYHLNIAGENSYLLDLHDQKIHQIFNDNFVWQMDAGRLHTAINCDTDDRYQLVVRKLIKYTNLKNPLQVSITPICNKARFVFDNEVSPVLNRLVKNQVLSNFSIINNGVIFDLEADFVKILQTLNTNNYAITFN